MRYIVVDPEGDPVFNCDSQSVIAKKLSPPAKASIQVDLDEPKSEDIDTLEVETRRTEGMSEAKYRIFKEIKR